MKSLKKALNILEFIVNHGNQPVTPGEAAGKLGLDAATCVRVMQEFTRLGYLVQVSRRDGYIPGPALFAFSDRTQWQYCRLARAAVGPVNALAHKFMTLVNISVLHNGCRYILYHYSADGGRDISFQTRYSSDFYTTATGRLLLATLPETTVSKICAEIEIKDFSGQPVDIGLFLEELKKISKEGRVCFRSPEQQLWIVGALVRATDLPPAAIGFGAQGASGAEALQAAGETARQIEGNLKAPAMQ